MLLLPILKNVKELYLEAIKALQQHDYDRALEKFIEVIRENRYYNDDTARIACLAIFGLLGEEHPIVKKHRPSFRAGRKCSEAYLKDVGFHWQSAHLEAYVPNRRGIKPVLRLNVYRAFLPWTPIF